MPLPGHLFAPENFAAYQLLQVPLQSFSPTTVVPTKSNQLTPIPMEVLQMPVQSSVATPHQSPSTTSILAPKVSPTRRFFQATRGRRKFTTAAMTNSKLDHTTSACVISTPLTLDILKESPIRPPPHA
jgi:hypothetical protein